MQSLRSQSELVPAPRGALPKVCAVGVAVVSVAMAGFMFRERAVGWVSMATLLLSLGPCLYGFFLLLEETLKHNNRYRRRSLLAPLSDCGLLRSLLSVIVSSLLLRLSGSPVPLPHLWTLLWLSAVLYAALRSLGPLAPCEVELSDICETRKMNVAHGLAWSFYLGYLRLVLPRLEEAISEFCASHKNNSLWSRGSQRLFILIPVNANISHKLEDEDDRIQFYESLPNSQLDRGGVRGRVYKHSVYKVYNGRGQVRNTTTKQQQQRLQGLQPPRTGQKHYNKTTTASTVSTTTEDRSETLQQNNNNVYRVYNHRGQVRNTTTKQQQQRLQGLQPPRTGQKHYNKTTTASTGSTTTEDRSETLQQNNNSVYKVYNHRGQVRNTTTQQQQRLQGLQPQRTGQKHYNKTTTVSTRSTTTEDRSETLQHNNNSVYRVYNHRRQVRNTTIKQQQRLQRPQPQRTGQKHYNKTTTASTGSTTTEDRSETLQQNNNSVYKVYNHRGQVRNTTTKQQQRLQGLQPQRTGQKHYNKTTTVSTRSTTTEDRSETLQHNNNSVYRVYNHRGQVRNTTTKQQQCLQGLQPQRTGQKHYNTTTTASTRSTTTEDRSETLQHNNNSVYRVYNHRRQAHDCVVEYATPLLTLYSMSQDSYAGFGEPQRREQVLLFYRTLTDILERSVDCRGRYTLILLNDEHEGDPHYLSNSLLRHLQQQDTEEYQMHPSPRTPPPQPEQTAPPLHTRPLLAPGPLHSPDMSRDPTLMFSLDRPRTLRGPVETSDFYK
ncbi:hypothetical protein WMY93_020321 [Mugilogobius chulae]|uniref:Stimulator of interferon genes protein n=1 Tax=Mugilogobius chulae TaxID=88201 RepID=A0AAW0NI17_9GOBI